MALSDAVPAGRKGTVSPPTDLYAPICRTLAQPLWFALRGDRSRGLARDVERTLALPGEAMERDRVARLRALLVHARDTVPFWRERMRAAGMDPEATTRPEDLRLLPALTRADVTGSPKDLLSSAFPIEDLVEVRTGGTTSAPVPFLQTRAHVAEKDAAAIALKRRMGWDLGVRHAALWGAAQDAPPLGRDVLRRTKHRFVERFVTRSLYLPAGDLSEAHLDAYAERLRRFRPAALQAYPSAADLLARRLLARGDRLTVPIVLLTAEPVFDDQRARVADALGAEVFSFYGARECGWIASECVGAHRLHVNTAGVHVEAEADGRLLVTDLVNFAMPLLRYEIGDRGAMDGSPCPCGDPRPVIARLEGRQNDVFTLPSGRRVPGVAFDRMLRWGLGIVEWQLVQEDPAAVRVRYVPAASFVEADLATLRGRLDAQFSGEVRLDFERVARIEPEANGKVRACIVRIAEGGARSSEAAS